MAFEDFKPVRALFTVYLKLTWAELGCLQLAEGRCFMEMGLEGSPVRVVHVVQGAVGVSDDPHVVYTALIGSSVLLCLYDPVAKLGGMAHFLFPDGDADTRFGAVAIGELTQQMVACGGDISRSAAKLYGGAKLHEGRRDMGQRNAEFAKKALAELGISIAAQDLGGDIVRRVRFHASSGESAVVVQDHGMPNTSLAGFSGLG